MPPGFFFLVTEVLHTNESIGWNPPTTMEQKQTRASTHTHTQYTYCSNDNMHTYVYYDINAHAKPNYLQQTESTTPFRCCRCGDSVRKFAHKTSLVTSARSHVITGHMFRGGLRARAEAWLLLSRLLFVLSSSLIIRNCIHRPLLKYNDNNSDDWTVDAKSCSKYLKGFKRGGRVYLGSEFAICMATGPKTCACGLKRTWPFISPGDKSCGNHVRDKHTHSFATNAFIRICISVVYVQYI